MVRTGAIWTDLARLLKVDGRNTHTPFAASAPYAARMVPRPSWEDLAPDKRQIVEWRFCQFARFVRSVALAERLALAEIDYHDAQEMIEAGCSEELLERILT